MADLFDTSPEVIDAEAAFFAREEAGLGGGLGGAEGFGRFVPKYVKPQEIQERINQYCD